MIAKSLILLGSHRKLSNAHRLVTGKGQPAYYVRVKQCNADVEKALSVGGRIALPEETLLNTVPIDFEGRTMNIATSPYGSQNK